MKINIEDNLWKLTEKYWQKAFYERQKDSLKEDQLRDCLRRNSEV